MSLIDCSYIYPRMFTLSTVVGWRILVVVVVVVVVVVLVLVTFLLVG